MEFIEQLAENAKRKLIGRPERKTDKLLGILNALGEFADKVENPGSSKINLFENYDIPSSVVYNKIIQAITDDINVIREHQQTLISYLLSSWNSSEQIISEPNINNLIDSNFNTANGNVNTTGDITLGVISSISGINNLSGIPTLIATCTDNTVPVFYGKAYGLFVPGNESGEDGIRPNNNDGTKIVDNLDTFWECEAVTLQEEMASGIYTHQSINTNELSITATILIKFQSPTNINFLKINPHSFAKSVYFDITNINLISGPITTPVLSNSVSINGETRITFPTQSCNAIQVTLKQDKGYFEKYHLAKYIIGNNSEWVDISGPGLIQRISTSGTDINTSIRNAFESADEWVSSIWVDNSPITSKAILDVSAGNAGYLLVESSASKRKRWAIGIQDIDFGEEIYNDVSEAVTNQYTMPDETTSIYIIVDDDIPDNAKITYAISFDDGSTWYTINPINKKPIMKESGYIVPQRIYINSDLSLTRKENSLTGSDGFINTANRKIRIRGILKKDPETKNTPRIIDITPIFDTGVTA